MKKIYSIIEKFFILIVTMMMTTIGFSQACPNSQTTISMENVAVTATTVEYDVYISNTGSTTLLLAALAGSIIYDENLLPTGATGTLSVVTQPTATGNFPNLNQILYLDNTLLNRQLRWAHTPIPLSSGNTVNLPSNTPLFFARFRFTSSIPWLPGTYTLAFNVQPPTGGYSQNLATVYCNGNTNSSTFTNDNGGIINLNRTFTITPEMLNTNELNNNSYLVSVSPNPFNDSFVLDLQSESNELIHVQVYDMLGKLLEDKELSPIDVSKYEFGTTFSSGVYNLVVTQGESKQNLKVIKR